MNAAPRRDVWARTFLALNSAAGVSAWPPGLDGHGIAASHGGRVRECAVRCRRLADHRMATPTPWSSVYRFIPDSTAHDNTTRARRFARQLHGRSGCGARGGGAATRPPRGARRGLPTVDAACAARSSSSNFSGHHHETSRVDLPHPHGGSADVLVGRGAVVAGRALGRSRAGPHPLGGSADVLGGEGHKITPSSQRPKRCTGTSSQAPVR